MTAEIDVGAVHDRLVSELQKLSEIRFRVDENYGGVLGNRFRLFEMSGDKAPVMLARFATKSEVDAAAFARRTEWVRETAHKILSGE